MKVEGKVVVVTGAAGGIGRAMAAAFVREGAGQVVVTDVDVPGVLRVATELGAAGYRLDVTREEELVSLLDEVEASFGPIDLFCSNAGILRPGGLETPDDAWHDVWEVNVRAHLLAARHLLPRMLDRGSGYLLNTASAAGLLAQIGSVTYSVSKHAAVALAEWIAIEYGDRGIGVSVLCPQAVRTAMTEGREGGVAAVDGMLEPEAVAEAVLEGLAEERFLILPHPEVAEYERRRAADRDRWLAGMRRLRSRYGAFPAEPEPGDRRVPAHAARPPRRPPSPPPEPERDDR